MLKLILERLKHALQGTIKEVRLSNYDCPQYLGYLVSYPRNKPIPDECMGCPKISKCLSHKKRKK